MAAVAAATGKTASPKQKAGFHSKKIEAVQKPETDAFRQKESALTAKIHELQSSLSKIQDAIKEKSKGRDSFMSKRNETRERLDEIKFQIDQLEQERKGILSKLDSQQEHNKQKRSQVQAMKKELQFETVEEIDEKINLIEQSLISSTVSLKQEKNLVTQIQQLSRMKPVLRECAILESDARDNEIARSTPLSERLSQIKSDLLKLRERRAKEMKRNDQLTEARQKDLEPVKDLVEKKNDMQGQLEEHRKKLMEVRDEHRKAEQQYWAFLQELHKAKIDNQRQEKRFEERQNQIEDLKRQIEDMECSTDESKPMYLMKQTVAYVQKLVDESEERPTISESAQPSSTSPSSSQDPKQLDDDFEVAIVPKKQREEDFYYSPKKKGGKRSARKSAQGKKAGGMISHDYQIFSDFRDLGVDPPLNYSDAAGVLGILLEKVKAAELKQVEREKENQKGIEKLRLELQALEITPVEEKAAAVEHDEN